MFYSSNLLPCGRLWLSQVEGKPSGGERGEGATIEQGRTGTLATDVLQTKKENNVKLTFPYFSLSLLDAMAEGKNVFSIKTHCSSPGDGPGHSLGELALSASQRNSTRSFTCFSPLPHSPLGFSGLAASLSQS